MSGLRELFQQFGNLFRWWVVVAPWEQGIRVRLGKRVTLLEAGVHLRIPFVDRVFRQSTRRRFTNVPTQTVSTSDGKAVTVSGALAFRIDDLLQLYDSLHQAEDTIHSEAMSAVASVITRAPLAELTVAGIEEHVMRSLNLKRYGLGGMEYKLTDFVAVRTYRLIQGGPKDWNENVGKLDTNAEDGAPL
jgi:hypothetical protein